MRTLQELPQSETTMSVETHVRFDRSSFFISKPPNCQRVRSRNRSCSSSSRVYLRVGGPIWLRACLCAPGRFSPSKTGAFQTVLREKFDPSQMTTEVIGSKNQNRSPPFYDASCVRLVSMCSRSLLKPAYADNKIRAWGDSLATWPEKR